MKKLFGSYFPWMRSTNNSPAMNTALRVPAGLVKLWRVSMAVLLGAVLLGFSAPVMGQAVNATLLGAVTDTSGAVVAGAKVTATEMKTGVSRSTTTNDSGNYAFANLPLGNNRNFQNLLNLVPGATRAHRVHSEFFNAQDSLSTEVNGQARLFNNLQIEGVDDNERTGLLQIYIPPAEAIQTVDVSTSNYAAEFGRVGGAVTNVILKSGTNAFHGAAYEFNRI